MLIATVAAALSFATAIGAPSVIYLAETNARNASVLAPDTGAPVCRLLEMSRSTSQYLGVGRDDMHFSQ